MSVRPGEFDHDVDLSAALSPFRAAFAKARVEGVSVTDPQWPRGAPPVGATTDESQVDRSGPSARRFEVRIEKRRGKRAADTSRWNKLGKKGWELVAVVGQEAFFRRSRQVSGYDADWSRQRENDHAFHD